MRKFKSQIIVFLIFASFLIIFREINYDEGWYLYDTELVLQGKLLYRDFAYTQSPVLPYIYGPLQSLGGGSIMSGRIISTAFAFAAFLIFLHLSARLWGDDIAKLAGWLFISSIYALCHYCITATYSLSVFFLALSFYFLFVSNKYVNNYLLSAIFISLATGVRLSILPIALLHPLGAYYISYGNKKASIISLITIIISFSIIFVPFLWLDFHAFFYNVLTFHVEKIPAPRRILDLFQTFFDNFATFSILMAFSAIYFFVRKKANDSLQDNNIRSADLLISSALLLFIVHFIPKTNGIYYTCLIIPLLCIVSAISIYSLSKYMHLGQKQTKFLLITLISMNLFTQSDACMEWRLLRYGYQNGIFTMNSSIITLADTAKYIRDITNDDDKILTLSTYLAVDAKRVVLPGLEMSMFSFERSNDLAEVKKKRKVNPFIINGYITRRIPKIVALTNFEIDLMGGKNGMALTNLENNYNLIKTINYFGQMYEPLYIFLRKQP